MVSMTADINALIEKKVFSKTVTTAKGKVVVGIPVSDLAQMLRRLHLHLDVDHKWRVPSHIESMCEDLGFDVINTGIKKGGGYMVLVCLKEQQ